jgi:benzoyl-CoA reductase/2-hydroxyglutaryl-CoA dehydratase subunit BcrC/BadD/HgdB
MKKIGITTTVPVEVLLAAGYSPVDLNNVFISDQNPHRLVEIAEKFGFPQNCCVWIKGIFGVCLDNEIDTVLCVTTGDCSNTIMLMEVLKLQGVKTIPFAYPGFPDIADMEHSLHALCKTLGTTLELSENKRNELASCRRLASELDKLTWKKGLVSGWENHIWLVSGSDFNGNYKNYEVQLDQFLKECRQRKPYSENMLRLAYIGVPPVFGRDMHHFIEQQGAMVVFNEIQRQFNMPIHANSLAEQYTAYTYPYSIFNRLQDIIPELRRRRIDGVIHYVQTFCHRGIGDIIFRRKIDIPVLTLEGNDEYILTHHLQTKIEAFLDMLRRSKMLLNKVGDAMKGTTYGFCS